MNNGLICLTLGIAMFSGCSGGDSTQPAATPHREVNAPPPPPLVPKKAVSEWKEAPAAPETPAAPQTVQTPAGVGVGDKGRGYGTGPIATPAAAYWAMREKITFDIQIVNAMNLYKGVEGRPPATHEEFMEKIIKANQISLPTLPEGCRYQYDPKTGLLMVEQPAE